MDAKDTKSGLQALQRLYGLLKDVGDGMSNGASKMLDEHARLLLKNLLDAETKRVLKAHAEMLSDASQLIFSGKDISLDPKMIAGQGKTWALSPTPLQQTDGSFTETIPRTNMEITTGNSENCGIGQTQSSDQDRKMDGSNISLWTEKIFTPQGSELGNIEQSIWGMGANGPENSKKRCRVCQRSTVKQLDSIESSKFSNVPQDSSRFINFQNQQSAHFDSSRLNSEHETGPVLIGKTDSLNSEKIRQTGSFVRNLRVVGYTDFSSDQEVMDNGKACNPSIGAANKPEDADCLSKEASKAIKLIELCVSALQIGTDHSYLFEDSAVQRFVPETKVDSPALLTQCGSISPIQIAQSRERTIYRNDLPCKLTSQYIQDAEDKPSHQAPSITKEEMKVPYLTFRQPSKLVQPTNSYVSDEIGESIEVHKLLPLQKVNKVRGQNVRAIIDKTEPGNWRMSNNSFVPRQVLNAQNFSVAPNQNEVFKRTPPQPAPLSSSSEMKNTDQNLVALKDNGNMHGMYQGYKPSDSSGILVANKNVQSVDSGLNVSSAWGACGRKRPPNMEKPLQRSPTPGFQENEVDLQHNYGISKKIRYVSAPRTSLTPASSSYSSNWRSQQSNSLGSDSEDYYSSPRSQRLHYANQTTSTETGASLLSSGTRSQYTSFTGYSADEVYSSTVGDVSREVTPSSSRVSKGYSSYEQPTRHRSRSMKAGPSRIRKPVNNINHKKRSGTWKRLKDKLAIIFHHHHHHHHHHHSNRDYDQRKITRNESLQKHRGKLFLSKREDEAYAENGVEKMGKSVIHGKNQQSHFHGLMRAFSRHVKQPKKEKIGPLAKGRHGSKKGLKKSHWWQLLQHHRAAKMANKSHVKIGFGKRKTRLKALPKLK